MRTTCFDNVDPFAVYRQRILWGIAVVGSMVILPFALSDLYQGWLAVGALALILEGIIESLRLSPTRSRAGLLRQISSRVDRLYQEQRKKTMLALDDAHLLEDGLLEDLRLLTNYEMDTRDPLVLLLLGHPGLRARAWRSIFSCSGARLPVPNPDRHA